MIRDNAGEFVGYFYGVADAMNTILQPETGMFFVNGETNSIWVWDTITKMWIDSNRTDSGMKGMLNDNEGNSPSDYIPSPQVGIKESYFYVAECEPDSTKDITFVYFKNGTSSVSVTIDKTSIVCLYWNGDYWEASVVPMNVDLSKYAKETDLDAETNRATQAETNLHSEINVEKTRAQNAEQTLQKNIDTETTNRQNAITALQPNLFKGKLYLKKMDSTNTNFRLYTDEQKTQEFISNYVGGEVGKAWNASGDIAGIIISSWHRLLFIGSSYMIRFNYTDENGNILPTSTTEGGFWRKTERFTYHTYEEQAKWNKVVEDFNTFLNSADTSNSTINRWKEIESFLKGITDTQTLTGLLESLRTDLQTNIEGNTTLINEETSRATEAERALQSNIDNEVNNRVGVINSLKSKVNQNVFCTTEEGNEIFKEVYIYPYVNNRNVREITITKQSTKYQITFKDSNDAYSIVYLGHNNGVINGEVISGAIEGEGFGSGATMYAVIDWGKVVDNKPISTNFTSLINDSKYSPIITHVMQSYKFVKGSLGNAFIRELYLENLRRTELKENGTSQTLYYSFTPAEIQRTFILSSIKRNVDSTWTINFGAIGPNGNFYPFKYETTENPENNNVIKADIICWIGIGVVQFKATMYAVVDWSQIPDGTSVDYGRPLLGGVVQKKLSPTISNYIEFGNKVEWSESFNLNDYKTQGIYYITGERLLSEYDNLPIMNASSGHTISGQLTVLDASLSDAEMCVTQYLKLTNRLGSEGKEYIRTYNKYSNGTEGWSVWREIKQTANLNQISDEELKNYTENGLYEGVVNNGETPSPEQIARDISNFFVALERGQAASLPTTTFFTMEVLNNYAVTQKMSQILGEEAPNTVVQRVKCVFPTLKYVEAYRVGDPISGFGVWTKIN